MKFSNPRTTAVFENWPFGGAQRCRMEFKIECHPKRGERCLRWSTSAHGRVSKPKKSTYSTMCRIVDGDDGKTYILEYHQHSGMVSIRESNLKFSTATFYPENEEHIELYNLFNVQTYQRAVDENSARVAMAIPRL